MAVFPTNYTDKTTLVALDKVFGYDSESGTPTVDGNKNFTLSAIQTYVLGGLTTTSVSEGTNKYYTEARVTANTTVVGKADKTNVLELDNTTVYTPTADYHPATKAYIDNFPFPTASESTSGIIELATDTETATGTDDTRAVTPLKLKDNYDIVMPGTTVTYFNDTTTDSTTSGTFTTLKTYTTSENAIFWASVRYLGGSGSAGEGRVLVNGLELLTHTISSLSDDTITGVVYASKGDTIDFQAKITSGSVGIANTSLKGNK